LAISFMRSWQAFWTFWPPNLGFAMTYWAVFKSSFSVWCLHLPDPMCLVLELFCTCSSSTFCLLSVERITLLGVVGMHLFNFVWHLYMFLSSLNSSGDKLSH
jgi:hypothetical protein